MTYNLELRVAVDRVLGVVERVDLKKGAMKLYYEDWKKFFNSDVVQVAIRASRILGLVELLKNTSSSTLTLKVVAGVIGRDTVGHSRDVQNCFRDFLGVECLGCRDLVEKVSMGIPLTQVSVHARLSFNEVEWLNTLGVLDKVLRESLRVATGLEISSETLRAMTSRDYTTLTGNPLKVFNTLRGFYVASRRILPLYSSHTFLIQTLRGIPRFALEKLVGGESLEAMRKFRIDIREQVQCEDSNYSLLSHSAGTPGDLILSAVDLVYKLHEFGALRHLRYLRVRNERDAYLDRAASAIDFMAELLGVKREFNTLSKILLSSGRAIAVRPGLQLVKVKIRTEKPARYIGLRGRVLKVEEFMKGLSPYSVLGLSKIESFVNSDVSSEADLLVYIKTR